jgi:hypothetical protein
MNRPLTSKFSSHNFPQYFIAPLLALAFAIGCPAFAFGQDGGIGGGGIDPGTPTTPSTPDTPSNGGGGGTQTGEIENLGDGTVDPSNVEIILSDDVRNQGFVGATAPGVQSLGFVGAASEATGPPLAPDATFGGGVNGNSSGGAGGGGRAGAFGGGQQGFGAAQSQNGFSVTRRNLRARLVPDIGARAIAPEAIAYRFQDSLSRLPQTQFSSAQYQISIANRTATVTGFAPSQPEADRIIRQLRLQPGVYQIDNQLQTP